MKHDTLRIPFPERKASRRAILGAAVRYYMRRAVKASLVVVQPDTDPLRLDLPSDFKLVFDRLMPPGEIGVGRYLE